MILVTGATGTVGSHVARALREAHVPQRAFVRDDNRAAALLGDRVELAVGDFADVTSVQRALDGIETVFLASANHPQQAAYEIAFIDAAMAAGVRRIVKLSAVGAQIDSPLAFWDHHGRVEEHLRTTSLRSVVLRASGYMTTVLLSAAAVRQHGMLVAPIGEGRISMIDPRDVADVAVAALTSSAHDGKTYVVTGSEPITYERVAAEITAATGRAVTFVNVPDEAAHAALIADGLPVWLVDQIITLFGLIRQGAVARVTDTFRAIMGREPRALSAFIREHAHLFGQDVEQPLGAR